jgi:hypothetical protein
MGATEWVLTLILGGILGMIGQGIRVVAGLKKVNDQAVAQGKSFNMLFQGSTLGLSLLIGFIAGTLAIIGVTGGSTVGNPSKELIITIIGAGYAGTDFIEGFIKKNLPASQADKPVNPKTD